MGKQTSPEVRLWRKIIKQAAGCWIYQGCLNKFGYGVIATRAGQAPSLTHRIAYVSRHGAIPEGKCILHTCDVPACVNPDHLFVGTRADNIADCVSKKRNSFGEKNGHSVLSERDVLDIRNMITLNFDDTYIASKFNVSRKAIYDIRSGKNWKYLIDHHQSE